MSHTLPGRPPNDIRRPTVAVLGAGIMGSSVALYLARRQTKVVLIDAAPTPFTGASRYNEGKIHLGYLYLADPSLATARKIVPGGLVFGRLVQELLEASDPVGCTDHDDTYLIHRHSVTDVDRAFEIAQRVYDLTSSHPDARHYLVPLQQRPPRRLSQRDLEARTNSREIVGGFEVAERSVNTLAIADAYVAALSACPHVEQLMGHRVRAVIPGQWHVQTSTADGLTHSIGPFDAVVNALWEGRLEIDASMGITRTATWTHRYRMSLFARTAVPTALRSAVIGVGPFGDVKNYDGRNLYLSWYPSGLLLESHALAPPPMAPPGPADAARIARDTVARLGELITGVRDLDGRFESADVRGGWVFAAGRGALDDPASGLHRRDDIGLVSYDRYFSVDTGKYSTAPYIAREVVAGIAQRLGC